MVHRGDGVFEAIKVVNGGIYLLDEHLERLKLSADMIGLGHQLKMTELKPIILNTVRAAFESYQAQQPSTKKSDEFLSVVRLFFESGTRQF